MGVDGNLQGFKADGGGRHECQFHAAGGIDFDERTTVLAGLGGGNGLRSAGVVSDGLFRIHGSAGMARYSEPNTARGCR